MKLVEISRNKRNLRQTPTLEGLVKEEYRRKCSAELLVHNNCSVNMLTIGNGSIADAEGKDNPLLLSVLTLEKLTWPLVSASPLVK